MKSISGKNKVIDYKVVKNEFDASKDDLLSKHYISNLNKNKVVERGYVYSVATDVFCVINTDLAVSNYCFGVLLGFEDIDDINDTVTGLKMDFEDTFSSLIADEIVAYDIKSKKILSFNDGIKKCMDDMLPPILTKIYEVFSKNSIDIKGTTCDVVIDGELCAEAVEVVLTCSIDISKLKWNNDVMYSCLSNIYDVLAKNKKHGISIFNITPPSSITFDIVL